MRKTKAQNGITLISLVITIIVLLILATVAISMAIDSNGLFKRAEYAAETWNESVGKESTAIENAMLIMNQIGGETDDGPTLPEGWDKEKIADVVEEGDRKAPIPTGYTASQIPGEDKISDGLVIYEGADPVTGEKDGTEHQAALTGRNQYVWIPVDDINDMVMCQQHPSDKLNTETALCTTCKESTPLVGKLYTNIHKTTEDSTTPQLTFDENSGYREPANLTDTTYGDASDKGIAAIKGILEEAYPSKKGTYGDTYDSIKADWLALQQKNFGEMAKSVAKYKGFYISRYEIQAGAASKKGANVLNTGSSSAKNWYDLYTTIQNSTTPESTVAQMIWGSQYDQVMLFVDGKLDGSEAHTTFDVQTKNDATRKRNSSNATDLLSGAKDADKACNIYDLENNYWEWTVEADSTDRRVGRGRQLRRWPIRVEPQQ